MNRITPEQMAKLPRWAQAEIQQLDRMVEELEEENATLRGEIKNPFVFTRDECPVLGSSNVLNDGAITIGGRRREHRWAIEVIEDNGLEIRAPLGLGLAVHPRVANTVRLKGVKL